MLIVISLSFHPLKRTSMGTGRSFLQGETWSRVTLCGPDPSFNGVWKVIPAKGNAVTRVLTRTFPELTHHYQK